MRRTATGICVAIAVASSASAFGKPPARASRSAAKAPRAYTQAMIGWHAPAAKQAPIDAAGRPMLVVRTLNHNEVVEVPAASDAGGFAAHDLDRVAHLLRAAGGEEHPIEPRTLNVLYRIQSHFGAPEVRIVSGYRVPRAGSHSNHGKGRAIDFVVPGVKDDEVAKFARAIGFVGVGIYPTSQFVHVDVRPRSYFWVDYSGPGRRNRERGILPQLAMESDKQALARGERGIEPFAIDDDVDHALKARGPIPSGAFDDDEDEGD